MFKRLIVSILIVIVLIATLSCGKANTSLGTNQGTNTTQSTSLFSSNFKLSPNIISNGNGTFTYTEQRLVSYATLQFNTLDGDLDMGDYALDGTGNGYYIRTVPTTQGQFIHIGLNLKDLQGNTYSISGDKLVSIVAGGKEYYNQFLTAQGCIDDYTPTSKYYEDDSSLLPTGDVIRVQTAATAYNAGANIKNTPVPTRAEITSLSAIPAEPEDMPYGDGIGFDTTSNSGVYSSVSSYSWNQTCGATANLLVFGDAHGGSASDTSVTGVTYDGSSLTFVRADDNTDAWYQSAIYFMYAPATGSAYSVSVNLSGGSSGVGGVCSYSGVKQSGQPDAQNGNKGNSSQVKINVVTVADNCWVFAVAFSGANTSNNQSRWGAGLSFQGSDTNGAVHPAGTQTMSWTGTAAYWAISAVSFAPLLSSSPSVTTGHSSPTGITSSAATVNEQVTAIGSANVTSWGTYYGTTTGYGSTASNSGTETSPFTWSDVISGLSSAYLYHYQAYATNSAGTGTGSDAVFLTLPNAPTSPTIGNVTNTTMPVSWTNAIGESSPVSVTIETQVQYSTSGYPATYSSGTTGVVWTTGTSGTITGLSASILYYLSFFSEVIYAGATTEYSTAYATAISSTVGSITKIDGISVGSIIYAK